MYFVIFDDTTVATSAEDTITANIVHPVVTYSQAGLTTTTDDTTLIDALNAVALDSDMTSAERSDGGSRSIHTHEMHIHTPMISEC